MKKKIKDEIVRNTIELMKCVTIKDNYSEFYKAFSIIREELTGYYIKEKVINGYPNLIISNVESFEFDVIFCCHVDVVVCDEYKPILEGNILKGRGSFDMKGQLAVVMSLLKNNVSNKRIALIVTSDEEIGGECCKSIIKDYDSLVAVVPDGGRNFQLVTEEKGLLQVEITVHGISAHASCPVKGENAILKAIDIYNKLLEIYPMPKEDEFKTSVNLSKLHGGDTNNKVCDEAKMVLDIRFNKDTSRKQILKEINNISLDSEIKILSYDPMFYVDSKLPIIDDFIKEAKKILKKDIELAPCFATSDAVFFNAKGIPVIMMNPDGDNWHNPDEYVCVDSLYVLYELFKILI